MSGGDGDDTYVVDNAADTVFEDENGGLDTVLSGIAFTLSAGVENLTLTGKANINGTGNDLANVLIGNTGNNTLTGGEGNDTYVVQNVKDTVVETALANYDTVQSDVSFTLGANLEDLTLAGKGNTSATGNDELSNFLQGNGGNNTLDGGAGADRLAGGLGNDVYYVDNHADVVMEQANGGMDTVMTTVAFDLPDNVENLTLLGDQRMFGGGNSLNNKIIGNSATNFIDGRAGADTMQGMGGDDVYFVDNSHDQVIEAANQGTDWVQSSISYTLPANVEMLILTSDNTAGHGNNASNELLTYGANTTLDGGGGNDTVWGVGYNSLLKGGDGHDWLIDTGSGATTLDGGSGQDLMIGGIGDNTYLNLNDGDMINDQGGYDTLSIPNYRFADSHVDFYAADYLSGPAGTDLVFNPQGTLDTLVIVLGNQEIALLNFFDNYSSTVSNSHLGRGAIEQFNFKDRSVSAQDIVAYLIDNNVESDFPPPPPTTEQFSLPPQQGMIGPLSSRQLLGSAADETLTGTSLDDHIQGLDGNDVLLGDDGDDGLYGGNQNDTLNGGGGNDFLSGGDGSDTYQFNDGWGRDVLEDAYQNENNTLDFSAVTANLTINADSGATDGLNSAVWQGQPFSQIIGGSGDDQIAGGLLATALYGGSGNDRLVGGLGNDSLFGGTGNDTLMGGAGDDTYYFSKNDGFNSITDSDPGSTLDVIQLDSTIQQIQVALYMNGTDLEIGYTDTNSSDITVVGQTAPDSAIERIELSDGSYLTSDDINQVIQDMAMVATHDGISLNSLNDVKAHSEFMTVINAAWHH